MNERRAGKRDVERVLCVGRDVERESCWGRDGERASCRGREVLNGCRAGKSWGREKMVVGNVGCIFGGSVVK